MGMLGRQLKMAAFSNQSVYHKDTEPLYNSFMHSLVSLLSGIYPLPAMHHKTNRM